MKKEVLFMLVLIISINIISASYLKEDNQIRIDIKNGWNIIPTYSWKLESTNSNLKMSDFSYGFIYDNLQGKYILVYNKEWIKGKNENKLYKYGLEDYYIRSSMWVYSEKDGEYLLNWGENNSFINFKINNYNLKNGWNFIFITPDMLDKSFEDITSECKIKKIFSFENESGFRDLINDDTFIQGRIGIEDIGKGILVKVDDECNFKLNESKEPIIDRNDLVFDSGSYTLISDVENINSNYYCENSKDYPTKVIKYSGEVCYHSFRLEFVDTSSDKGLFVVFYNYDKAKELHQKYLITSSRKESFGKDSVYRLENHELFWFPVFKYDTIFTQEFQRRTNSDGTVSYSYGKANGDNPITKYYLEKYSTQNNSLLNEIIADSCTINAPFDCLDFKILNLSEVVITVSNLEKIPIKIKSISISNCEINTNQGNGWSIDKSSLAISIKCNNLVKGSRLKEDIVVRYSKNSEILERTSTGTLSIKVN